MALHSQLPLLVAAYGDAAVSRVSCWDYVAGKRTSTFASGGGGSVSALELLNPNLSPLLLLGHTGEPRRPCPPPPAGCAESRLWHAGRSPLPVARCPAPGPDLTRVEGR